MTVYISSPVAQDRATVRALVDAALTAQFDGNLEVPPGSLVDFMADVAATISANDRQLLTEQLAAAYKYFALKVDRIPQGQAVSATAATTWVRSSADATGGARTVPAGTEITLAPADPGDTPVSFITQADFTFGAGVTATSAGAVGIVASVAGTAGNGLQSGAQPALTTPWLVSVTVVAATAGGEDAQDDDDYLNFVADTSPLQSNAIAKADDLARWLRNQAGVDTALVLDNYNGSAGQPGHVTAWVRGPGGVALSGGAMTVLVVAAQAITLTNLIVHVLAPVFTVVTVAWVAVAEPGWDTADVEGRAAAAVLDFLDPATWGRPSGGGDVKTWNDVRVVRFQDVSTVLNNVDGFDHWTSLTINGVAGDLTMSGPGALPDPASTAAGTVTAP